MEVALAAHHWYVSDPQRFNIIRLPISRLPVSPPSCAANLRTPLLKREKTKSTARVAHRGEGHAKARKQQNVGRCGARRVSSAIDRRARLALVMFGSDLPLVQG